MNKNDLSDRRGNANAAKVALLATYRAAQEASAPLRDAKMAERLAIAEAREARRAEREQAKLDEQARIAAEAARLEAEELEAANAKANAVKARIALVLSDEAVRKAERDRRYAARKSSAGRG